MSDSIEANGLVVSVSRDGEALTIELAGEIDIANAHLVAAQLRKLEETDAARIVVDLTGIEFIDSTGLKELFIAQRRSDQDSDRLRFRNLHGDVAKVVEITGLDRVLRVEGRSAGEDPRLV